MRYIISESRMDSLIYDYLSKNYTPDGGWLDPLQYKRYVDRFDNYEFTVNGSVVFVYVSDKKNLFILAEPYSLILWEKTAKDLTSWFGNMWRPVMIKWFEDNTGLEVKQLYGGVVSNKF